MRSDRAHANDSRALYCQRNCVIYGTDTDFLLSSFLSRGEVNNGFDDKRLAIVKTTHQSNPINRQEDLLGSRHLKTAPSTNIFASLKSTGIILICLPRAVNRLVPFSPSTAPKSTSVVQAESIASIFGGSIALDKKAFTSIESSIAFTVRKRLSNGVLNISGIGNRGIELDSVRRVYNL
jgi:hypothetical protein